MIIGGATGSGKTTTLAALVNEINQHEARHIVTIEDPIEYEHSHNLSVIEQVEIGIDAPDFPTALRAALRQAPDVIVVGEMRDPETARIALSAAETGHLVFTTLHTTDAASTVSRIADSFPQERQHSIRAEMAMALAAILTQTLIPRTKRRARAGGGTTDCGIRRHGSISARMRFNICSRKSPLRASKVRLRWRNRWPSSCSNRNYCVRMRWCERCIRRIWMSC